MFRSKNSDTPTLTRRLPSGIFGLELERVSTDVGPLWISAEDQVMRSYLQTTGNWEPELGSAIQDFAARAKVFLDIGANLGYFTRMVALKNPQCAIHAFEPHPVTASLLEMNTWEFGERVHCWHVALGDKRDSVGMRTEPNNVGDTHVDSGNRVTMLAPMVTLDELLPETSAELVKLDVQGTELSCLRGMLGLVRRSPHINILAEFWPHRLLQLGQTPSVILQAYRSLSFTVKYQISGAFVRASDQEILQYCANSGPDAQATLLLSRS